MKGSIRCISLSFLVLGYLLAGASTAGLSPPKIDKEQICVSVQADHISLRIETAVIENVLSVIELKLFSQEELGPLDQHFKEEPGFYQYSDRSYATIVTNDRWRCMQTGFNYKLMNSNERICEPTIACGQDVRFYLRC